MRQNAKVFVGVCFFVCLIFPCCSCCFLSFFFFFLALSSCRRPTLDGTTGLFKIPFFTQPGMGHMYSFACFVGCCWGVSQPVFWKFCLPAPLCGFSQPLRLKFSLPAPLCPPKVAPSEEWRHPLIFVCEGDLAQPV